jgi:hypothetical protein
MKRSSTSVMLVCIGVIVSSEAFGAPVESRRYPFDPACAWGRLSDGRGLFVRCLTKEDAERLTKATVAPIATSQAAGTPNGAVPTAAAPRSAKPEPVASPSASSVPTPTSTTGIPSAGAPDTPPPGSTSAGGTAATPKPNSESEALAAELVSVTADDGELPLAKKKLSAPIDRYAKCVADHGGLTAAIGQVEVRFLVRERGRAEGTSAEKFHGVSEKAAACVAQVIDRRPTGVPSAPLVGATAVIQIRKRPAKSTSAAR